MYPSFNYIGSKTKLLNFLKQNIEAYTSKSLNSIESFGDLFSGTGIVSFFMISEGVPNVVSNDLQYYSYIISSVLTKQNMDIPKLKNIIQELNHIDTSNPDEKDFIYNNFTPSQNCNRMFLTTSNGLKVDRIRQRIEEMKTELNEKEYNCLLKLLLYSVTKVSNTSSTFGAYLKQYKESAKKDLLLDMNLIDKLNESEAVHLTYNTNINDLDLEKMDVLYLDPPYNQRRYDKNYDFLTTVAKYDSPIIKGITGLRVTEDNNSGSSFCSKASAKKEFKKLFDKSNTNYIFMSYSSESLLSKAEIIELLSENFDRIVCYEQEYKRFKSNKNCKQDKNVFEYLFAGTCKN